MDFYVKIEITESVDEPKMDVITLYKIRQMQSGQKLNVNIGARKPACKMS